MSATSRPLYIALALLAILWFAVLDTYRLPAPKPIDAPATQFSGMRAKVLLQRLLGDGGPHPIGSVANAQVRARIVEELQRLGFAPQLQTGVTVCGRYGSCAMPSNVVARLAGYDPHGDAVLLAAHYDSVPAGPGASDDAAGVATVLEIAGILKRLPRPRHSIILLLDDGEEAGLLGAEAFVQHHPWATSVSAAVNLEARGTSGPSLMFETGSANRWLMDLYARSVARPLTNSVYYAVYKSLPNDTDFTVFKSAGYQGFNFAFIGDVMHYHTALDDWQHADAASIQQQGETALATIWALANAEPGQAHAGESMYFDLFGRVLLRTSLAWALPISLCLLPLVLLAIWRLIRRDVLTWHALRWGAVGVAAALAAGAAAAEILLVVLRQWGPMAPPSPYSFIAHPWTLQLSFASLAFWITALVAAVLRQRAGYWGLWCASVLVNTVLALLLAVALPGASYVLLVPSLVAWLTLMSHSPQRGLTATASTCGLVTIISFAMVLPVAVPLYAALGSDALPIQTVLLIDAGFTLIPLYVLAAVDTQRLLRIGAAFFGVLGLAAAALMPRYTPQFPQRLNLQYLFDADSQRALWLADPGSGRLASALRSAAAFTLETQSVYPWVAKPMYVAVAPRFDLALPGIEVLATECSPQRARYHVHVVASTTAAVESLLLPPGITVQSLAVDAQAASIAPLTVRPRALAAGWSMLRLSTPAAGGVRLLLAAAASPLSVYVVDQSVGLPPQGAALQAARGADAISSQDGDVTLVMRSARLGDCTLANAFAAN